VKNEKCKVKSVLVRRAGYSLLEVLLALVVLVIGIAALTSLIDHAQSDAQIAAELSAAQIACQTRLNEMLGGVRPIVPVSNEPVPNLPYWFFSVDLQPAEKIGLTSVRAAVDKERSASDVRIHRAGIDHFELVCWVNTDRIPQNMGTGATGFNGMGGFSDLSDLAIGSSGLPTAGDMATFRPAFGEPAFDATTGGEMANPTFETAPPLQIPLEDLMPQASQATPVPSNDMSPSDNTPNTTPDTSDTTTLPDAVTSQNGSVAQNEAQNDVASQNESGEVPPLAIPDENDVSNPTGNATGTPNGQAERSGL